MIIVWEYIKLIFLTGFLGIALFLVFITFLNFLPFEFSDNKKALGYIIYYGFLFLIFIFCVAYFINHRPFIKDNKPSNTEYSSSSITHSSVRNDYSLDYDYDYSADEYEDDHIPDWVLTPESSAFSRIGYDKSSNLLYLDFRTTGLYVYFDVPPSVWGNMQEAESKGRFFHAEIKDNYEYSRLN